LIFDLTLTGIKGLKVNTVPLCNKQVLHSISYLYVNCYTLVRFSRKSSFSGLLVTFSTNKIVSGWDFAPDLTKEVALTKSRLGRGEEKTWW